METVDFTKLYKSLDNLIVKVEKLEENRKKDLLKINNLKKVVKEQKQALEAIYIYQLEEKRKREMI